MIKKLAYVLLALFTMVTLSISVYANENYKKEFIKGTNGEISTIINKRAFKKADEVILINENASIDAISVTPLAYLKKAPIITTSYKNINQDTIDYLKDLGVKKVTIIGGLKSVSKTIENKIQGMEIEVERIYGNDRYETSQKIAKIMDKEEKVSEAIVISSLAGLENAIAISDLACKNNMPILWSNDNQIQDIANFVNKQNYKKVYALGNDERFTHNAKQYINNVELIKEMNRYDTNINDIKKLYNDINSIYTVNIEYGNNGDITKYLSLPAAAAHQNIPILICNENLTYNQEEFIKENVENVIEVGEKVGEYSVLNTFKSDAFFKAMIMVAVIIIIIIRGIKS